nr:hypothetical protein BaRGS_005968 [Batillaria attramentaria]
MNFLCGIYSILFSDAFQNVPNVCANNPSGQLFFAHPTDPTKFMQCDVYKRMFIIQCPQGEEFVAPTNGCQPIGTQTQTPTPQAPPATYPPLPPVTSYPPATVSQGVPQQNNQNNPCTPEGTARGQLYYSYPGDNSRFYECDLQGHANVMNCPTGLVWDLSVLSCVYPMDASSRPATNAPTLSPSSSGVVGGNPCTSQAVAQGRLFFPHPDRTKFIQCDLWGDFFVNDCPNKLVWNAYLETCYSPFLQSVPSGRK